MKTLAICLKSSVISVRKASGVAPRTSPPINIDTFDPQALSGHDFYYFKLHGLPDERFWYGDSYHTTTCSAGMLAAINMRIGFGGRGAVVFVANCYFLPAVKDCADACPHNPNDCGHERTKCPYLLANAPMLQALFTAGARAIVGGPGENYARTRTIAGADLLGKTLRLLIASGMSVDNAFSISRLRVMAQSAAMTISDKNNKAEEDTLGFQLITRDQLRIANSES